VITVAKATSAGYYTDGDGGSGMESYYLDAVTEGEPPGRWRGRAAELLGLSGVVTAEAMETLYEDFVNPVTGEQLGNRPAARAKAKELVAAALAAEPDATAERRAQIRAEVTAGLRTNVIGWDLTFAVPKSVTILHTAASRGMIAAARDGDGELEAAHRWVREQIDAAIERANAAGLAQVEALTTARAGGGAGAALRWEQAQAVLFASFYQHTSRSIEPHLHVHNVALNRVLCGDGKWRAIDGQDLLAQRYAFSAVADRVLMEQIAALGYDIRARPDGAGMEASLIDEPTIDLFSTRHQQTAAAAAGLVDAFVDRYGREPTGQELSALKSQGQRTSRADKDHSDQTADELNDTWFEQLIQTTGRSLNSVADASLGAVLDRLPAHLRDALTADQVTRLRIAADQASAALPSAAPGTRTHQTDRADRADRVGQGEAADLVAGPQGLWSPQQVIEQAVAGCAARSATWGRANLLLEIERTLPVLGIDPGDVADLLDRLTDRALQWSGVVQITHPTPTTRATDGAPAAQAGPLYAPRSATLYAAADTLVAEAALRGAAVERGRFALPRDQVAAWLDEHTPTIGADQRAAVEGLASSDAALAVLVGPAGTGKSFAAGALATAWHDLTGGQGRVLGVAVSQVATDVLRDDGIPLSRNIARWLATQDRLDAGTGDQTDHAFTLRPTDVVLIDEASMVGTSDFEAIRARVDAAGARMVVTGDPRQLGPVEAGGAMGLLDGHAETFTLTEVRRFTHNWERAASLAIRDGATDALAEYDRHARLLEHATAEDAAHAAARAAVADRVAGRSVVVVTATNDQAAAVAARVRDQLVDLGLVAPDGGVLLGRDGNTATVGDVITCRRNDYNLGVTNRVQYRVLAGPGTPTATTTTAAAPGAEGASDRVVPDGCLLVETVAVPGRDQPARQVLLPAEYVAADVQLGYASTVHSAQGLTVDTAHLVAGGGSGLDAATLYVGMTRGRERNTAHVALATPAKPSAPAATTGGGGEVRLEDDSVASSARSVLEAGLDNAGPGAGLRHLPGAGTAATVAAERDAAVQASMATLTARIEAETRVACRARLDAHLDDAVHDGHLDETVRAVFGADRSTEHLSRLLRVMEQDGHDPRQVLLDALTRGKSLTDATSPAQVLSHRITHGRPDHTLVAGPAPAAGTAIPAGIPEPVAARLADLHARATARTETLGRATAEQAPEWAVQALGPVPAKPTPPAHDTAGDDTGAQDNAGDDESAADDELDDVGVDGVGRDGAGVDEVERAAADRADWERRAGVIAAHREAVGFTDPTQALPRMPGLTSTERRAGYTAAWHALGRPDDTLTEAALSDGRLLARIQAWEREKTWQPAFVDDQLRAAETALNTARQAAGLAEARAAQADTDGDTDQAAKWRADAATHHDTARVKAAAVEGLTAQAETYTTWAFHTALTRDHAERARAEADRRGLDLAAPADTTTADQWLAHQAAAITAEDTWRPVTEADLTDHHDATQHADADVQDDKAAQEAADHDADQAEPVELEPDEQLAEPQPPPHDDLASSDAGPSDDVAVEHDVADQTDEPDRASHEAAAEAVTQDDVAEEPDPAELAPGSAVPEVELTAAEIEQMSATTAAVLSVLADRASEEAAHTAAVQEDLAIEAADAGRRRRELADLDAALPAGAHRPYATTSTSTRTNDAGASADDDAWD